MEKYKDKRRIRKIKKFGEKLGIIIIFLAVSYLISLFSFYLYTQLSQILLPETKGFFGFAIIGLIAGFVSVLVSFVNNRFILTVVISFFIYCLIDSFLSFSNLGIQVIQFLPGLLVSMSAVIAPWYFLKRKLVLFKKKNKVLDDTKEHVYKECALARKLIENPNKLTLETFKEACGLLEGIDPKIDAVLKKADYVSRTLTFLNGKDVIGFAVANIKVKTKEDEEKKEKLLFFIDLVHDIWEEVNVAFVRLDAARGVDNIGHQGTATITASGPSGIASVSMAIVAATTVVTASAVGIIPGSSLLPKNNFQIPETQNTQEVNTPGVTSVIVPSTTPTATPTVAPTLAITVNQEVNTLGVTSIIVPSTTPTPIALAITVDNGWGHFSMNFSMPPGTTPNPTTIDETTIPFYVSIHNTRTEADRLIGGTSPKCNSIYMQDMNIFGPPGSDVIPSITVPASSTAKLKFMGQRMVCEGANGVKLGDQIPVTLNFEKYGKVPVTLEIRPLEKEGGSEPDPKDVEFYAECDESPSITIYSLNVFYFKNSTVELSSGRSYWIRMSIGFEGDNGEAEAIADKNNITLSVTLNGSELKLSGDTKIEYNNSAGFWEINGYYCTGILEEGSYKIVGTSYRSGNYVDSASFILITK